MSKPASSEAPQGPAVEGRFGPGRLALAVALVAIWFLSLRNATDFDYGWHVESGRHLSDGVLLGGVDVYTWTAAGAPWVAHEWLTEIGMAVLHDGLGPTAVSFAAASVVASAFLLVALRIRRRGFGRPSTMATIVVGFAGTLVSMGVRPQLLELLYLSATLLVIDVWWSGRLTRVWFWVLAAVGALVSANSHGSFPLLVGTLSVTAAAAFIGRDRRWPDATVAAAIAVTVPLVNPWGPELYGFVIQNLTSHATGTLVQEYLAPNLLDIPFVPFTIALILAAVGALRVVIRRDEGRARMIADLLMAAAFLVLALRSGRHVMLFGIAAAPLLASAFALVGELASRPGLSRPPRTPTDARGRDVINASAFLAIVIALVIGGSSLVGTASQAAAVAARYPKGLLSDLDRAYATTPSPRLFNEYTWGGYLIAERPGIPVFIDGRNEVSGDEQLLRYAEIAKGGPGAASSLLALGVTHALIKADSPLVADLEAAGWQRIVADPIGVLWPRLERRHEAVATD